MKANYQKLAHRTVDNSFNEFWVKTDYFGFHWHYHEEIEICYIKQGRGKRIIGDSIADFEDGDLVLVGSNLPHSWITDELFNQSDKQIEVYVIHFDIKLIEPLGIVSEFESVAKLLEFSKSGIEFRQTENSELVKTLLDLEHLEGFAKYLKLLELLNMMSIHDKKYSLSSSGYRPDYNKYNEERILKVCNYIHDNYKDQIATDKLANLISMNTASFCRFFKRIIGKTVIEYINELRIGYVCNQLQHSTVPIYKISFDAGFSSVAYFNRVFKRITNKTPKEYRSRFHSVSRI